MGVRETHDSQNAVLKQVPFKFIRRINFVKNCEECHILFHTCILSLIWNKEMLISFFLQFSFPIKKNIHVKYEKVNKFLR